jgi:hypothetical protein
MISSYRALRRATCGLGIAVLFTACYQPPAYVVPTSPPTITPVPANATAVAAVQSGPLATQIALTAATSVATSPVRIVDASLDPENVANSAVTISNTGSAAVDLSGWMLLVANVRVTLPTTQYMTVAPGHAMTVHLSSSPTPTNGQNVYVGLGALQNTQRIDSDRVVLLDPGGQVASLYPPSQ